MTKDEGCSVIDSDFNFLDFGLSMKIMADQLARVNTYRDGVKYQDDNEAKGVDGAYTK